MPKRNLITTILLLAALLLCFGVPKPKYQGTDTLSKLNIPTATANWRGKNIDDQVNPNDLKYNFISKIFIRDYANRYGQKVTLLILDAGNFHNPKVCFSGAGYKGKDIPNVTLKVGTREIKPNVVFFEKTPDNILMVYWICIDKKIVNWTGQKFTELWSSLLNKKKSGYMVRLEIPVQPETVEIALKTAQEFISDLVSTLPQKQVEYIFGK